MRIDNNLNTMIASELQIAQSAQQISNISNVASEPKNQEVTADLIDKITSMIPNTIAYSANANSIQTQNEVSDMLLNIKA